MDFTLSTLENVGPNVPPVIMLRPFNTRSSIAAQHALRHAVDLSRAVIVGMGVLLVLACALDRELSTPDGLHINNQS
jgi:hypothetical protein